MRLSVSLAACALAGCNWVLGLDVPLAQDGDVVDALDGGDGGVDADGGDGGPDADGGDGGGFDGGGPHVVGIAAGGAHTCAWFDNGDVRCWGRNNAGQLGYGNTIDVGDDETPAAAGDVQVGGLVTSMVLGDAHTCVIFVNGVVRCWGEGLNGRLGYSNVATIGDNEHPFTTGDVLLGGGASRLAAGAAHTCAVRGGQVLCWGSGMNGRLGYGNLEDIGDNETPNTNGAVALMGTATRVAAGDQHTCALLSNGAVQCWGSGGDGRLGYGNIMPIGDNEGPMGMVSLGDAASEIVTGGRHSCALLSTGQVRCWGYGAEGALGLGGIFSIGDNELPTTFSTISIGGDVQQLAAGDGHTCALLVGGAVRCWGRNDAGQLGYGNVNPIGDNETPASAGDVQLGLSATMITAGDTHTCALLTDHTVRCWGQGAFGRLGYASSNNIGDNETPLVAGPVPL